MHSSASVTVSMGELTTGTASLILRDTWLDMSTCTGSKNECSVKVRWVRKAL